jgi:hypothetical protein
MTQDEKLKVGYQGAMQMIAGEAGIIWSAFQSILAANAFLIILDGALIKLFPGVKWAAAALAISGIIICLAWFLVLMRQFSYFRYWIAWARSLEEKSLSPETQMLGLGRTYGKGATVDIPKVGTLRMSWAGRIFKVQWPATFIVFIISFMYVLLLGVSLTT